MTSVIATSGPRDRIVRAAVRSIRERGVAATSMRDVVELAGAPRGSLQHYFPGGKDQLVAEALAWSAQLAADAVRRCEDDLREARPSALFAAMARAWADQFNRYGYARGCPMVAASADVVADDDQLRALVADAFELWLAPVRDALRRMGVPAARARSLAVLMISSLEGAIVLARSRNDTAVLRTVTRELGPLLDAAVA